MVNDYDRIFDMVIVTAVGKAFFQYCEICINGESMVNRIKDILSEMPKFIEPTSLTSPLADENTNK